MCDVCSAPFPQLLPQGVNEIMLLYMKHSCTICEKHKVCENCVQVCTSCSAATCKQCSCSICGGCQSCVNYDCTMQTCYFCNESLCNSSEGCCGIRCTSCRELMCNRCASQVPCKNGCLPTKCTECGPVCLCHVCGEPFCDGCMLDDPWLGPILCFWCSRFILVNEMTRYKGVGVDAGAPSPRGRLRIVRYGPAPILADPRLQEKER